VVGESEKKKKQKEEKETGAFECSNRGKEFLWWLVEVVRNKEGKLTPTLDRSKTSFPLVLKQIHMLPFRCF
jgi:hypothetical protein